MKVPQLTATLASRGLGTKDEPLLRLDQVLPAEAEEGADFEFPAGFSADGRLLVERLDLTHLPGVARRPLFKILVALFQAVDPSHGSHDEQIGRAAAWAKELRQKAGLPLLKRDRSRDQDLSTFAATVVSDIHRALGTDDDENTLALALAAALGPPALVQPGGGAGSALGGGVDPNPMQDTYTLDEGGILGGSRHGQLCGLAPRTACWQRVSSLLVVSRLRYVSAIPQIAITCSRIGIGYTTRK